MNDIAGEVHFCYLVYIIRLTAYRGDGHPPGDEFFSMKKQNSAQQSMGKPGNRLAVTVSGIKWINGLPAIRPSPRSQTGTMCWRCLLNPQGK